MKLVVLAAAALALVVSTVSAEAGCVQARSRTSAAQKHTRLPAMPSLKAKQNAEAGAATTFANTDSIVGLWKVVHLDENGALFFDGLEQWHGDGTELEIGNVPPAIGNICVGVWKFLGRRTYQLNHIGLDFTPDGDSDGIFTLTATVKTNKNGTHFEGPSDVKIYDAGGNLVQEVVGSMAGDRIPVE
jgi:hypothetical protein